MLCYVTDRKTLPMAPAGEGRPLIERIAAAAAAGLDWIQVREKDLSGKEISLVVREALVRAKQYNQRDRATRILLNDRLDVALAQGAGGVHLGEHSLPVRNVSQWLGSLPNQSALADFLVGVSCHSLAGAVKAERDGADHIFFGPLFATPSKTNFGAPQGLDRLSEVCRAVALPVLAIGGVTLENASSCLEAGAAGIAAIRLFQDATDLSFVITQLRAALA
ncbi:MAG: thiamine phosphate synthase [Acidobacteriota bacterium]|nr:thiamine phosphate synthase [Acidobacteriota bacterium]